MTNQNNDVDVNVLIKIYNQKIGTLTNQNMLLVGSVGITGTLTIGSNSTVVVI